MKFAADDSLAVVHCPEKWADEYAAARKGQWEEYGRDRCRFQQRIRTVEDAIGHIFKADHRQEVFEKYISEAS